ncbi:hypothetical protein AC1031_008652 [Aphanomyces cochlioides]|nr:hypothetical protein AC1031_008652 [Aphanomyces cochlioides]
MPSISCAVDNSRSLQSVKIAEVNGWPWSNFILYISITQIKDTILKMGFIESYWVKHTQPFRKYANTRKVHGPITTWDCESAFWAVMKTALLELQVYRAVWNVCWPFVRWFVRVKDRRRFVPALIANERTGVATSTDKFRDHPHGIVWIHGASVGECLSALPLIKFLTHESDRPTTLPTYNVLLTTTTPSARQLLNRRLQSNPKAMCIFAPLDHATCVNRFLDTWRPAAAIWIESEIWPNLIAETASRQVPMAILNGRMSIQSFDRWNSWFLRRFAQFLLSQFQLVLCQSPGDLRRFQSLGQADAKYLGDLKFVADKATIDQADLFQLQNAVGSRVVWVAASTHEGEEDIMLATHVQLLSSHLNALLVLIPRHPHRVPTIIRELSAQYPHLKTTTRTQDQVPSADSNVFIVDTMGETQLYYEAASVVFVGGSLVPIGGHNILEPLRSGCTVLHGPHMTNFTSVVQTLQSPDVVQVSSSSLLSTLRTSLDPPSRPYATGNQSLAPIQDALWANVTRFLTG